MFELGQDEYLALGVVQRLQEGFDEAQGFGLRGAVERAWLQRWQRVGEGFEGRLSRALASLSNLSQTVLQPLNIRTDLRFHVSCNASVTLLDNSAEALLSRFSFQSRIACCVAFWASDPALWYAVMQASAFGQFLHPS